MGASGPHFNGDSSEMNEVPAAKDAGTWPGNRAGRPQI